jgi:hypothetical protein
MSPLRSLIVAALALLCLPAQALADVELSVGFSDPEFIAYFRQAILARPLPGHDDQPGPIAKFTGPIKLLIVNATDRDDADLAPLYDQAKRVIADVGAATGLAVEITMVNDRASLLYAVKNANLLLFFGLVPFTQGADSAAVQRYDIAAKNRQLVTPCKDNECGSAVAVYVQGARKIDLSFVKVEPSNEAYARAAISEGLLRAVSDAAAVDASYPSVLGWHRDAPFDRPGLGRMDRLMLQVLYDPRLAPNLTPPEIEALLPAVLADAKAAAGG